MDKLKENGRYLFCGFLILAVMAVYGLRLADWQLINGASFLVTADKSRSDKVTMTAARGEILDVSGNGLAVNKTGYAIVFERAYMTKGTENKTVSQLIALLNQRGEKWVDVLPITRGKTGKYEFIPGSEKEAAALKSKDFLNMNSYATADDCMTELIKKYNIKGFTDAETRNIVSVRYNMTKSGFGISSPYTFAADISKDTVAIISENAQKLPGTTATVTTVREYPSGSLMPHIVGTMGAISKEEYDKLKDKGYAFNDRLGKSGIEQAFESTLRGTAGEKTVETTAKGALAFEKITVPPESGKSVYLTIDSSIQKVLNASLAQNVQATQANGRALSAQNYKGASSGHGEDCVAGGAVVLRVKDFSVLAASTYPSYDLAEYLNDTNYYSTLIQDKTKPLINRAFNGAFTPGSSFKPLVACAALQENSIFNNTIITCNHTYLRFAPSYTPTCMGTHGPITLATALQKSCNVFFFETGWRTGIDNIDLYAKRFGLGQKSGIELSETSGLLAGPAERAASGGTWQGGDTIQAAIGQSDNLFSPLQLASYVATIANNGVRLKTHLVSKVTDYTRGTTISTTQPVIADNVGVSQQNLDYVKKGMREVVQPGGTAAATFGGYGIAVAGKTGTAQVPPGSDNEIFIGFAPYDKPEIAVAVVLEHGATGKYCNQVAKDVMDAYFYGKTVDANGNLVMPNTSSAASGSSSASSNGASSAVSSR